MDATAILTPFGLAGLVIAVLASFSGLQYRENRQLYKERILSEQEHNKVLLDIYIKTLQSSAAQTQAMEVLTAKIETVQERGK